jgi:hypothetical protein
VCAFTISPGATEQAHAITTLFLRSVTHLQWVSLISLQACQSLSLAMFLSLLPIEQTQPQTASILWEHSLDPHRLPPLNTML